MRATDQPRSQCHAAGDPTPQPDPFFYCGLADMFRAAGSSMGSGGEPRGLALHPHSPKPSMGSARCSAPENIQRRSEFAAGHRPRARAFAHMSTSPTSLPSRSPGRRCRDPLETMLAIDLPCRSPRNLGMSHLLRGNSRKDFRSINGASEFKDGPPRPTLRPPGKGHPKGKRFLIHSEQGYGDTIQFCRYLPILREAGARLVLNATADRYAR